MDQIPVIHNYYADLLMALANYFDLILGNDTIQHYEFNIGNKSFQLNYKTQKGLPSCIINYNSSRMQQYHDWFLHRPDMGNPFLIPIVYDATKDLSLYIQEAQYEHSISIMFNCNTVFEMLEIEHKFAPYLPMNKYIEVFNYYTFFEIPKYFLNTLMFDVNRDTIHNLYTRRDSLTNDLIEMSCVKYDPMIRVDSLQNSSVDADNKTFTLEMELTVLNSIPLYFQIPSEEIPILKKKINEIQINHICLPLYENIPILQLTIKDHIGNVKRLDLPLLNIDENKTFKTIFTYNDYQYGLTGKIESKVIQYAANIESDNYSYPVAIKVIDDEIVEVNGILTGIIILPVFENDTITGTFQGDFNTTNLSIRSHIAEDVTVTLDIPTKLIDYTITNVSIEYISESCKSLAVLDYNIIPYGKITLFNNDYSDHRLNVVLEKSIISQLGIYDYSTNSIKFVNTAIDINKYGNIKYVTENKVNDKFTEYYSIDGCINPYTWHYSFVQNNEQEQVNSQVLFVVLDGTFNNSPKYGGNYIDRISFDILSSYPRSLVYLTSDFYHFRDFNFNKIRLKSLVYSVAIPNIADYVRLDDEYAYLNLVPYDRIDLYRDNLKEYHWSLFFQNHVYTNLNSDFILAECLEKPFYYAIALKIPIKYYLLNFAKHKEFNDIFYFKLFSKGNE